jgi:phage RecT family recombinase
MMMLTEESYAGTLYTALKQVENEYQRLNNICGYSLDYSQEANFVYQTILASNHNLPNAYINTSIESIVASLLTSASIGISLCSNENLSYLKTQFDYATNQFRTVFDFTYKGYLKLIYRSKMVKIITADVIYSNDKFEFNGTRKLVTHKVTKLSTTQRGDLDGGYCTSELLDNSIVTTVMSAEEIFTIENMAKMYENSAWNSAFVDELRRKTLIRRHWKTLAQFIQSKFDEKTMKTINHINLMNDSLGDNDIQY